MDICVCAREFCSQALFAMPPTAVRTKHFQLLSSIFAQVPLPVDDGSNIDDYGKRDDENQGEGKGHQRRRLREAARVINQAGGLEGPSTVADAARAALVPLALSTASRLASAVANRPHDAGVAFAAADAAAVVAALEVHDDNEDAARPETDKSTSHAAQQRVVPLTSAQKLALCEALVLAVRWSGNAAPHYAPVLLPTLIKGAAPPLPPSQSSLGVDDDHGNCSDRLFVRAEAAAAAALRASCFSGLAEMGSLLGWGVAKYGRVMLDLCLDTLTMERPANDDLFAKVDRTKKPAFTAATEEDTTGTASGANESSDTSSAAPVSDSLPSTSHHALAARRGAAFLAKQLVGSCSRQLLHSETSCPSLHRLWCLLKDISKGPGVSRAWNNAAASESKKARPLEWSLETDPIVRAHLTQALESINELMLSELQLQ